MKTSESKPRFFWDPVAAGIRPGRGGAPDTVLFDPRNPLRGKSRDRQTPKAPPNPARIAGELLGQFESIPGWTEFQSECAIFASLSSSPGWEDSSSPPKKTCPGATAIGLAQWGAAIATAGLITSVVPEAGWPSPGIEPEGFIWLNWRKGASEFSLELHANLLHQSYKWTRIIDGTPREHKATQMADVVEALKQFQRSVAA